MAGPELLEMKRMSVKLDEDLVRKAKMVATSRGQTVIEYIEGMIGAQVQRDLLEEMRKRTGAEGDKPAPKRKRGEP
jgi:hypothetical protein